VTNYLSFLAERRNRLRRHSGWLARLRRNQSGSAAIEFAIVSPFFFLLMFVIAETAMIFIAEQVMDNALFETARLIRTGQAQQGTWPNPDPEADPHPMTEAEFRDAVCGSMSIFIDCAESHFFLDIQSYDSFAEMDTSTPIEDDSTFSDPGAFEFGGPGDIVIVRAYYQWPTNRIFGNMSLASRSLGNGKHLIGSFAAFCNEPYQTGGPSNECG
jgi:Flp pilus assembly protein TadG